MPTNSMRYRLQIPNARNTDTRLRNNFIQGYGWPHGGFYGGDFHAVVAKGVDDFILVLVLLLHVDLSVSRMVCLEQIRCRKRNDEGLFAGHSRPKSTFLSFLRSSSMKGTDTSIDGIATGSSSWEQPPQNRFYRQRRLLVCIAASSAQRSPVPLRRLLLFIFFLIPNRRFKNEGVASVSTLVSPSAPLSAAHQYFLPQCQFRFIINQRLTNGMNRIFANKNPENDKKQTNHQNHPGPSDTAFQQPLYLDAMTASPVDMAFWKKFV